jgi:phosphoribosylamine--glycine ligase
MLEMIEMVDKVLLIGHGSREHAIAKALVRGGAQLYSFMSHKNPGIAKLSKKLVLAKLTDFKRLKEVSPEVQFAVVGPEAPLAEGISDVLDEQGVPCVGPKSLGAKLESSKSFARELLEKHQISANPRFKIFSSIEGIRRYLKELGKFVVKPDGLTGGKGVKVFGEHLQTEEDALQYCQQILKDHNRVIIEECLEGEEFTLQAFVDGSRVIPMPLVQDHKRAYDGDTGPNTGGMGSYSCEDHSLPFVQKSDVEKALEVMQQTVEAIKRETGVPYQGFLYGQFMLTKFGPKIIEYNVRLGDPEAMNVLPLLQDNFVEICWDIIHSSLKTVSFAEKATVCSYLVPEGYPSAPLSGEPITIGDVKTELFYGSVHEENGRILTTSSRSIALLGVGATLEEAHKQVVESLSKVQGKLFYRQDIGTQALVDRRVENMRRILNP